MKMMTHAALVIGAITVAGLGLSACANKAATNAGAGATVSVTASATANAAQSQEWANEGSALIAAKASMSANAPEIYRTGIVNWAPFAVRSLPVDIVGNGTYTLKFPMSAQFNPPVSPIGMAFIWPPDFGFAHPFTGQPAVVAEGGTSYYEIQVRIDGVASPYDSLTVWAT
jgi:hypothetical protein